jgi:hypothetical protein
VIQVAVELIEPVHGGERFIAVAEMILAELARRIAEVAEHATDRGIELAHAHRRAGKTHLGETGTYAVLAGCECGAARGTRLLGVVMEEYDALLRDTVDIGRFIAHQAATVRTDVGDTDVIAPDHKNIRLRRLAKGNAGHQQELARRGHQRPQHRLHGRPLS